MEAGLPTAWCRTMGSTDGSHTSERVVKKGGEA